MDRRLGVEVVSFLAVCTARRFEGFRRLTFETGFSESSRIARTNAPSKKIIDEPWDGGTGQEAISESHEGNHWASSLWRDVITKWPSVSSRSFIAAEEPWARYIILAAHSHLWKRRRTRRTLSLPAKLFFLFFFSREENFLSPRSGPARTIESTARLSSSVYRSLSRPQLKFILFATSVISFAHSWLFNPSRWEHSLSLSLSLSYLLPLLTVTASHRSSAIGLAIRNRPEGEVTIRYDQRKYRRLGSATGKGVALASYYRHKGWHAKISPSYS